MNDDVHDQTTPAEADGDLGYLLTAYADGQLALEGMAWVEEQLDRRPELRARLKEIRGLQAALRVEFARFPAPTELGGFARGQVLDAAQRGRPSPRRQWALAALLVIGVSVSVMAVMVTMGESAAMRVTTLDDSAALSPPVGSPTPIPSSTIVGLSGAIDRVDVEEQRGGVDANMVVAQEEATDASEDKRGETLKAERDVKELTGSGAFMSVGAGSARHPRRSDRKPGASSPSSAADLAVAEPGGQVESREKDVEVQRQAAKLKKQDGDGEATRSSFHVSGVTSTSPVEGLTDQLAANAAKPAPVAPATVAAVQSELAAEGGGRASGGKRRAGADAARPAAIPAGPVAQDGRQEAAAARGPTAGGALDRPAKLGEVEDDPTSTAAALTQREEDLAKLTKQDNNAVAKLGIVTERYPKVWNDVADQYNSALTKRATIAEVRTNPQGQSDLVMLRVAGAAPVEEGSEFFIVRGRHYVVKVRVEKALDGMVACRVIPESWNADGRQIQADDLAISQIEGIGDREPADDSASPSQRLAAGNAQRAPRDRVAALLATASVNATAPLATLLRTTAGPDGALAASPALDEVLARPAHLETHDLPSGQALLQLARGAGLQARVLGGVVTLDVARGQLDPTDTQGLDRASFTKAFGTVPMVATADDARSTFALDANTASFERARAQLRAGQAPDPAAIQAEHFINAMPMEYPAAQGPEAFTLYAEAAPSPFALGPADAAARAPWAGRTAVVAIGAVARPAAPDERRPLHLTLALDCSGSMAQPGGLDRVRLGLEELLTHLRPVDTVAVVAFSDQARVVLPATPGGDPAPIARALAGLTPGGATNAVEGLALAYQLAAEHLEPGSENRVLFATDGGTLAGADAQVVIERVAAYKSRGITLLVVGCGGGAYQGRTLQQLADRAGGQHVFLGSDDGARSAFASRLLPERLAVLAKDAKVQVTWNPQRVSHFRLIGYEQRRLAHQDFRNDAVDAGEISHDTQVTALYEVLLVDGATGPLGSAAVRYFDTRLQQVRELSCPLAGAVLQAEPGQRLRLVACAAEFAAWLQRGWWSNVRPTTPGRLLGELARCPQPQARELEELVQRAAALQPQPQPIPLNRNAGQSNAGNASAPTAPTGQAAPKP